MSTKVFEAIDEYSLYLESLRTISRRWPGAYLDGAYWFAPGLLRSECDGIELRGDMILLYVTVGNTRVCPEHCGHYLKTFIGKQCHPELYTALLKVLGGKAETDADCVRV